MVKVEQGPDGFGLHPRSIGELLDLTFRVFRSHFRVFALLGVGIAVPATAVGLTFNALTFGGMSFDPALPIELDDLVALYGYMGLSLTLTALIYSVGSMAITAAAEATLLGRPVSASQAVADSLGRSPAAAVTGLLVLIATTAGMLMCCLPAIPVVITLALAVPLVFLERTGPLRSLTRSHELIFKRGPVAFNSESNWLRVLIVGVVTLLVVYVISFAANLPLIVATGMATIDGRPPLQTPLGPQFVGLHILLPLQVLGAVIQGLFVSISIIPWTLTYYDIRARHEGLDLEAEVGALAAEPDRRENP